MKHYYAFIFAIISIITTTNAQNCVIDNSNGSLVSPTENIPSAQVGVYYEQVFQIKVPTDTSIVYQTYNLDGAVNTFTIDDVANGPDGLTYSCEPSSCSFPGGSNACVKVSGTPTESGTFYLDFHYTIDGTFEFFNNNLQQSVPNVYEDVEVVVAPANNVNQISKEGFNVFPNPASDQINVQLVNNLDGSAQLSVVNLLGKQVYSAAITSRDMMTINTAQFEKGVYFVQVVANGKEYTKKLIIK